MNTGDVVTDSLGRTWQVGQPLGRGLWGGSWVVRGEGGRELVLKVAHARTDFPPDARLPEGIERACATCAEEQASLLKRGTHPFLPRLEDRLQVAGRPALLLPRYTGTLARRMSEGASLAVVVRLLGAVAAHAEALAAAGAPHGNLRPENVLLREDGAVVLADPLTPTAAAWRARLEALAAGRRGSLPPEADELPRATWDTWSVCDALYAAAMWSPPAGESRAPLLRAPATGLDKVALSTLRDRAMKRLRTEGANPRFVGKVCERLASLLNRGLSQPTEPSPPYRFHRAAELRERIDEVGALIHPRVEEVGKILLPASAPDGVYTHGAPIEFAVTVSVTEGVASHEHIACGLRLTDLDAPGGRRVKVEDASFDVKAHPSGRLRFHFTLRDVPPGRYAVNAAFAIHDSGEEPIPAKGEISVRPPPGYVPPLQEDPPPTGVLTLPRADERDPVRLDAERIPGPIAPTASPETVGTAPTAIPTAADATTVDAPPARPAPRPAPVGATSVTATVVAAAGPDLAGSADPSRATPKATPKATPGATPKATPGATATATPGATPKAPTPRPAAPPAGPSPGEWGALPDPEPPAADDWVPAADVADLPEWSPSGGASGWRRWLDVGRRDTFTAIAFVTALLVVVLVCASWLLRACSG